jgi:hypothetical protein
MATTTWMIAAVAVVAVLYAVVVFNRLIRQRNIVREGWSGIDVQLRRRTDLVPNPTPPMSAACSRTSPRTAPPASPPAMWAGRRRRSRRSRARSAG